MRLTPRLTALLLFVAASSCALPAFTPNVTSFKATRSADGTITINSGKDVKFDSLDATNARTGETVSVKGYSSMANTDAINAETTRETAQMQGLINAMNAGAALAGKIAGAGAKAAAGVP